MKNNLTIVSVHEDWQVVNNGLIELHVTGSYEKACNLVFSATISAGCQSPVGSRYYADSRGKAEGTVYLWIGSLSCSCGPGGLVLECDVLPSELVLAERIRVQVREYGYYIEAISGSEHKYLKATCSKSLAKTLSLRKIFPVGAACGVSHSSVLAQTRYMIMQYGNVESPLHPLFKPKDVVDQGMRSRIFSQGRAFCKLINAQCEDESSYSKVLSQLVGLGKGSTPSADDFIVGVLVACALTNPALKNACLLVVSGVLKKLSSQTTYVSRGYLLSAPYLEFSDDVVSGVLMLFVVGVTHGRKKVEVCPQEIKRLLQHGATSGTDLLAGVAELLCVSEGTSDLQLQSDTAAENAKYGNNLL